MSMPETPNLKLPLLAAGQASKHVTHNDALFGLDLLVQISVTDLDLNTPPTAPTEGDSRAGRWPGSMASTR